MWQSKLSSMMSYIPTSNLQSKLCMLMIEHRSKDILNRSFGKQL